MCDLRGAVHLSVNWKTKALLIDTGAVAEAKTMPLAQTVISLLAKRGSRLPLMVVHTHGHLDHRSGDDQFRVCRMWK